MSTHPTRPLPLVQQEQENSMDKDDLQAVYVAIREGDRLVAEQAKEGDRVLAEQMKDGDRTNADRIKDVNIALETLRRDIAVGMVPRDVLDLHLKALGIQMQAHKDEMTHVTTEVRSVGDDVKQLRVDLKADQDLQKKEVLDRNDRKWSKGNMVFAWVSIIIGSLITVASFVITLLNYLHH